MDRHRDRCGVAPGFEQVAVEAGSSHGEELRTVAGPPRDAFSPAPPLHLPTRTLLVVPRQCSRLEALKRVHPNGGLPGRAKRNPCSPAVSRVGDDRADGAARLGSSAANTVAPVSGSRLTDAELN
jgi:hypothetical protein